MSLVAQVAKAICKALPDAWVDTFRPSGRVPDDCLLPFDEEPCDGRVLAQAAIDACHAEEMREAIQANDALLRDIRHRDAHWRDDELVKQLLKRNRALLAKLAVD